MKKALLNKTLLRTQYLFFRKIIPCFHRNFVTTILPIYMANLLSSFSIIGSFVSTKYEINTSLLNLAILKRKKLILLKITNDELIPYHVENIQTQLIKNKMFNLFEPNPYKCKKINIEELDCILIPGIIFDKKNNRLGYGKGFYDKLLTKAKKAFFIGLGYKIQLYPKILPYEKHDVSLHTIFLFLFKNYIALQNKLQKYHFFFEKNKFFYTIKLNVKLIYYFTIM